MDTFLFLTAFYYFIPLSYWSVSLFKNNFPSPRTRWRGTVSQSTGSRWDQLSSAPSASSSSTCVRGEAEQRAHTHFTTLSEQSPELFKGYPHRFSATISDVFVFPTRGVQLKNPFYSIWASDVGTELAVSFDYVDDFVP